MSDQQSFLVFFRSGAADLDAAAAALQRAWSGWQVVREGDAVRVAVEEELSFLIRLSAAPHVRQEAMEIGAGTAHEKAMADCDARFEATVSDFAVAMGEMNSLMQVQEVLQKVSSGYLFLSWNGELLEP